MIRHRAVFDAVRDAIFVADVETGRILDANRAAEELSGRRVDDLQSRHVRDLLLLGAAAQCLHDRSILVDAEILHNDGHRIPVEVACSPFTGKDGQRMIVGVFRDVTERRLAEEVLRRSEARAHGGRAELQAIMDAAPAVIFIAHDAEGRRITSNRAGYALLRRELGSNLSRVDSDSEQPLNFRVYRADEELPPRKLPLFTAATTGQPVRNYEVEVVLDDGTSVHLLGNAEPMFDDVGRTTGAVSVLADITERKKAEAALRQSEVRLRANEALLLEAQRLAKVGSWEVDLVTGSVHWSEEMFRIYGLPVGAPADPASFLSHVHPKDRDIIIATQAKAESTLEAVEAEFRILRPNGEARFVRSNIKAIRDDSGVLVRWVGSAQDITDEVNATELLREREKRLRNAERLANVGNWHWDVRRDRVFWSDELLRIFGHPPDSAPRYRSFLETVLPEDRERVDKWVRECLAGKNQNPLEYRIVRSDDDVRTVRSITEVSRDARGSLIHVSGTCQDITETIRARQEAFARQKLESIGTLAGGIAHDFNNLLGGVVAQAEMALAELDGGASPEQELRSIRDVAMQGAEIVRQLMIYAGKENDAPELVDLSKLLDGMLDLLRVSVSKIVVLKTELSGNLPPVRASAAQLRRVLMNLVTNSSEALGDEGGVIRVHTGRMTLDGESASALGVAAGDYVRLAVADTGAGISVENQAKVFDPFFTTKSAGRGLGLAVVQGIVRNLQGAIRVSSDAGEGATFEILLPSAEVKFEPARPHGSDGTLPRRSNGDAVLVVEDEPALRRAVVRMLQKNGFDVLEAADGSAAAELIHAHSHEIKAILLDLTIPGRSSQDVVAEASTACPHAGVLLTSAYTREMVTSVIDGPQIRGFIRKPFRLADLVQRLQEIVSATKHGPAPNS